MSRKDSFLLRTDPAVLDALRRWANDELRSANGQLEFILRRALIDAGRLKPGGSAGNPGVGGSGAGDDDDTVRKGSLE